MKKPRTKAELLADPRIQKIDGVHYKKESDVIWQEYDGYGNTDEEIEKPSYWLVLADGWNNDGCSVLHEKTIKALCDSLDALVTEGDTY